MKPYLAKKATPIHSDLKRPVDIIETSQDCGHLSVFFFRNLLHDVLPLDTLGTNLLSKQGAAQISARRRW